MKASGVKRAVDSTAALSQSGSSLGHIRMSRQARALDQCALQYVLQTLLSFRRNVITVIAAWTAVLRR